MSRKTRRSSTTRSPRPAVRKPGASRAAASQKPSYIARLKTLYELSMTLSGDPVGVFEQVARMIGELFDVRVVCLSEIRGTELYFRAVYANGQIMTDAGHRPLAVSPCATVERTKDICVFDHVTERFPQATFLRDHNAYAYCGFPALASDHRVIAVTCLLDDKPHEFSEEDQEALRIVGQRIALEIERDRHRTERQQADEALRESEERFRQVTENIREVFWLTDLAKNQMVYISPGYKNIWGRPVESLHQSPLSWLEAIHAEDRARIFQAALTKQRDGTYDETYRIVRPDGSVRWIRDRAFPVHDHQGAVCRIAGLAEDITEHKQAEEALRRLQAFLHSIVENIPGMVFVKDAQDLRFVLFNKAGEDLIGYLRGDLIGKSDYDFFTKEQADFFTAMDRAVLADGRLLDIPEEPIQTKDKGQRLLHTKKIPILDEQGVPRYLLGLSEDITERKRAEKLLARSRDFYLSILQNFPAMIWRSGVDAKCDYFNNTWLTFTGRTLEQELGDGWAEGVHPDDVNRCVAHYLKAFHVREPFVLEYRLRRYDGGYRYITDYGSPLHDLEGSFTGFIGACFDITERKRLEEELRQAQKMEAVGRLAGGIAHDFNNLLMVIGGCSTLLLRRIDPQDPQSRYVRDIKASADRAAALTRQLLAYSRRQVLEPQVLSLNDSILAMDPMLRRLIGEQLELALDLSPDLGPVKADPGQIEQVIMNLALNARDAMPNGGRLTITTMNAAFGQGDASKPPSLPPGAYAQLIVTDTGQGMDQATLAHLFEPFFTTKDVGKGTGLGLATVYGIVAQSGGVIWATSEPGQGTTLTVCLPQVAQAPEPLPPAGAAHRSTRGSETILLAEDEAAVRALAREVLEEQGYRVLEARNGVDALALAGQHVGPIHLLLTDVIMPKMSGHALARRLTSDRPGIKVLYMSGYTEDPNLSQSILDARAAFLPKPMLPETLLHKVRDLLDAPA